MSSEYVINYKPSEDRTRYNNGKIYNSKIKIYIDWNVFFELNKEEERTKAIKGYYYMLRKLTNYGCKLIIVGQDVSFDEYEKENILIDYLFDKIKISQDIKNFSKKDNSYEIFYLTNTVKKCKYANEHLKNHNQKIISISNDLNERNKLAYVSIVCNTFKTAVNFILLSKQILMKDVRYIVSGFSGMQKLELHKKLRGARLLIINDVDENDDSNKIKNVDIIHQEFNVEEESWDKTLWGIKCFVKNNVKNSSLKKVTDKAELFKTMKKMFKDYKTFIPNTFSFEEYKTMKSNEIVIVKPVGPGAFSGAGITVVSNNEELRKAKQLVNSNPKWTGIICTYINNPLLFQGKKFHLRTYLMATSWNKFFTFPKSRILTAKKEYIKDNYNNKEIHDTHVGSTEKDFFFPNDFDRRDHKIIQNGLNLINDRLTKALQGYVKSYDESEFGYQILALDILFDNKYNPWLLEVNTQPGFKRITNDESFEIFEKEFIKLEFKHGIMPNLMKEIK